MKTVRNLLGSLLKRWAGLLLFLFLLYWFLLVDCLLCIILQPEERILQAEDLGFDFWCLEMAVFWFSLCHLASGTQGRAGDKCSPQLFDIFFCCSSVFQPIGSEIKQWTKGVKDDCYPWGCLRILTFILNQQYKMNHPLSIEFTPKFLENAAAQWS